MNLRRWRGVKSLVHAAVDRTIDLVEEGHESTARGVVGGLSYVPGLGLPLFVANSVRRISTVGALSTARTIHRVVQGVTDIGIDAVERVVEQIDPPLDERPVPMRSDAMFSTSNVAAAALGMVNGIVGDMLHAQGNGLNLGMRVRIGERYLPIEPDALRTAIRDVTPKLAVFVHGLATTEWSWCLNATDYHGAPDANFGTLLARDLGYTPVWVRYNTGRHVSENGRELTAHLEALVSAWPVEVEEIVLVGHSMGGLVIRSASHYAGEANDKWLARVKRMFCLGSPHRGAALERFGHVASAVLHAIDTPGTRIPAMVLQGRSAGIKDMRHGSLVDEDWLGRDLDALSPQRTRDVPLVPGIAYHFVSATMTEDPEHPLGKVIGDMFVRASSAAGPRDRENTFRIETRCYGGVMHHQLQNHPDVYAQIRDACATDS